jgi:hypothetical protein
MLMVVKVMVLPVMLLLVGWHVQDVYEIYQHHHVVIEGPL